jgi:hypothetical protein
MQPPHIQGKEKFICATNFTLCICMNWQPTIITKCMYFITCQTNVLGNHNNKHCGLQNNVMCVLNHMLTHWISLMHFWILLQIQFFFIFLCTSYSNIGLPCFKVWNNMAIWTSFLHFPPTTPINNLLQHQFPTLACISNFISNMFTILIHVPFPLFHPSQSFLFLVTTNMFLETTPFRSKKFIFLLLTL